jgi:hypothetical protein
MAVVVALFEAFSPAPNAALAQGGKKDGMRADRSAARVPSPPGATGIEARPVETNSISLSVLLDGAGVETSADVGRFLTSLLPPSFELLSGGGIVVTDSEFTVQYAVPSDRAGVVYSVPDPEATADDGPLTDVVEFSGWAADYVVTGSFFMAGHELIIDMEWTRDDGTIVLVESFASTVHRARGTDATSGNYLSMSASWKCKCSHGSGACSKKQCGDRTKCYTGGAMCSYVWGYVQ